MPRLTFFHLFYSTTFTFLSLILLALVLVPLGDTIQQSQRLPTHARLANIFVISGSYLLTGVLGAVLYTARMYTFRRLLAAIPQSVPPVSRRDLPKRMHAVVTRGIARSAMVARGARPCMPTGGEGEGEKVWGALNHPGWAPPGGELRGVEYAALVAELPALLEREAAELVVHGGDVDPRVVSRPPTATLRAWLEGLVAMELAPRDESELFVALYERARFRTRGKGVEESEFRALMKALRALRAGMCASPPPTAQEIQQQDQPGWEYLDGGREYEGSVRVDRDRSSRGYLFEAAAGYGGYETVSSEEYGFVSYDAGAGSGIASGGYTPDRSDAGSRYLPSRARTASGATIITQPRRRSGYATSSIAASSVIRGSGAGGDDGDSVSIEFDRSRDRDRRLSVRPSSAVEMQLIMSLMFILSIILLLADFP
ncbi:hypothetical protein BZA05DRAFT_440753 [Tricharina praecox]|uniref:uncharacterized protein n=1 Tax=Tricharina praecox TaxID=43433 RepID=UPI00221F81F5|nr:uncharacterized protein BZA05DRAFT_440753 [Tricharina praecox]KAI5859164.1 hypothetical protein BZA05DRAFT_440753 [Tricharina praecox]